MYVQFLRWDARFLYQKEKCYKDNEGRGGGGRAVSRYNDEGNWSALFA
ncbi:lipid IV(A) palmitoyltransferase PagP, partial [Enterobacter hormaechei]